LDWTVNLRLLFTCVPLFVSRVHFGRKPYMALLKIRNLTVAFPEGAPCIPAVQEISLTLAQGEILGLIGDSGSGKSVIGLSIGRLLPARATTYLRGSILLDGHHILSLRPKSLRLIRGRIVSYVFQHPGASLHPLQSVGTQIRESLRLHQPKEASRKHLPQWLDRVGVPDPIACLRQYPHQLTPSVQQRVMIAIAIASRPKLLVADEPTASLDITTRYQITNLLRELRTSLGLSVLILSRNPLLVSELADHLAILHAGQIVESGPARDLLRTPLHPVTQTLLRSVTPDTLLL
jgi:ABC-type dipeptide/oligopeptide/nickel transport system ATPase component